MIFIYKDRLIQLEWSIFRGTSQVPEDFSRALVKLFLVGNYEKYAVPVTAEGGTLVAQMPQDLPDGAYSLEAIWVKNYNNLFPVKGTGTPTVGSRNIRYPGPCHNDYGMTHPWDHRSNDRCLMRSRKDYVFAVTSCPGEETAVNEDSIVTIRINSAVATYGYDGLSAYELAVMRGDFNGTEGEYLEQLKYELKVATDKKLGGITASEKTDGDTVEVKIDPKTGKLYVPPSEAGEIEVATETTLGGIKAAEKTEQENVEVKIDSKTGKLYTKSGNNPDDEDLHLIEREEKQVLQFADKEYNASSFSGLGRVYLRKNISDGKNVLTQAMMSKANTRYVIQYDYDLTGETITVPEGCTLEFEGGSLKNGTIDGNRCTICCIMQYSIFNDVKIKNFNISYIDIRWFGSVPNFVSPENSGVDNALYIERALEASMNHAGVPIVIDGCYKISSTITTKCDINLVGNYHNNRTFFSDSTIPDYTNPTSLLYVDNCIAFKMVGRGTDTQKNNNISIRNLYLKGNGSNSNSVFIEYSATGSPSRVGYVSEVEVTGFNKFLYLYDDGSNSKGTLYGNLTIEKVFAYYNKQFLVTKASGNLIPTLCNLIVRDSTIEQNGERTFDLENLFGANIITNCILEGQKHPIKASIINGSLEITNNYFEANGGDYLVNVNGKNVNNCFVRYENNYKLANANGNISLTNVTILGYNTMNNDPSKLNFSGSYIESDILHLLSTDSFNLNLNIRKVNFYKLTGFDENTAVLHFGQTKIERNLLGRVVDDSGFKQVAQANINVNAGDTVVLIFYRGLGTYLFNLYDSAGAPITDNYQMTQYGRNGMDIIKLTISKSSSGIYLYVNVSSGTIPFGNGFVFKNPDAVRLSNIGIFPEDSLRTVGLGPQYASVSGTKSMMFFDEGAENRGAYYGDGVSIRNSDGALFGKEEIVSTFVQYYSLLRPNKVYKIVGDLDLNGTQVIIPAGCVVDFSRGGTISNGIFSLTNTLILPQGLNINDYVKANITGSYKEGQVLYDSSIKKQKLWNGTNWVNLDGTALPVETKLSEE